MQELPSRHWPTTRASARGATTRCTRRVQRAPPTVAPCADWRGIARLRRRAEVAAEVLRAIGPHNHTHEMGPLAELDGGYTANRGVRSEQPAHGAAFVKLTGALEAASPAWHPALPLVDPFRCRSAGCEFPTVGVSCPHPETISHFKTASALNLKYSYYGI